MQIERVLMVDDDSTIRRVAELALTRVGKWNVLLADSGQAAIDVVDTFKPDMILLDVMMPGMDGLTAFKILKQKEVCQQTPIIFMTAKVQRQEVQSYYQVGAAGVIIKPFDPLVLPAEIKSILKDLLIQPCTA